MMWPSPSEPILFAGEGHREDYLNKVLQLVIGGVVVSGFAVPERDMIR
jgi:hypothetical protein